MTKWITGKGKVLSGVHITDTRRKPREPWEKHKQHPPARKPERTVGHRLPSELKFPQQASWVRRFVPSGRL